MYLGYSAAALAAMGYGYYLTRNGAPALGLSAHDLELVAEGAIKGALHTEGLDSILTCVEDPKATIKSFEDAIKQFEKKDMASITMGFMDMAQAFKSLAKAVTDCDSDVTKREIEIFESMLKSFEDPKSLAIKAGQNIVLNGVEIYHEISAAYTSYKVAEYENFGRDMGVAMALVFIGACDPKKSDECDPSSEAMRTMVKQQLYPTGLEGDDNSMYLAFLDTLLRDREEAEYRAEHPESPDDIIAPMPGSFD